MSSGAGAGNAVHGLGVNSGVVDIDDQQVVPVQPSASPAVVIAAIGAASASMNPIRGRRQPRVDRQIRRPGLEHRQNRHDRLSRPRKQQRHTRPGPAPWPANRCANRLAASSSSR